MSDIALRYLGGAFIHGVPARDLTAAEAAQHGTLIAEQEAVTGMKMYDLRPTRLLFILKNWRRDVFSEEV
jgi:hypothetical protein